MAACKAVRIGIISIDSVWKAETKKFCPPQSHQGLRQVVAPPPRLLSYLASFSLVNSNYSDSIGSDCRNHSGIDWQGTRFYAHVILTLLWEDLCVENSNGFYNKKKKLKWERLSQSSNIYSQTSSWSNKVPSAKKSPFHPLSLGSRIIGYFSCPFSRLPCCVNSPNSILL